MIRLTIPSIGEDELEAVRDVLSSGFLVQGEKVAEFESIVADYVGTKYAVAVSNCTAALHIALLAIDVRPGDLVVVTSYSWLSTANVVELCGAQPVFVDICSETFNMSPECLKSRLKQLMAVSETARRVKAIIPVHTFGQMADMPSIMEIAGRYDIPVIEDAACALGASIQGRKAGKWGVMGCFSFHPRKAITTGEGGVIATDDINLVKKLQALRNHGLDPDASTPNFVMPGFNYRMTEFQAALGIIQMNKLDRIIFHRRQRADIYNNLLAKSFLHLPISLYYQSHIYQSYVVLLPEYLGTHRDAAIEYLKEQGIEATIGTWNMPMTNYLKTRYGYRLRDFPVTDAVFLRSLSLPIFDTLSYENIDFITNNCYKLFEILK